MLYCSPVDHCVVKVCNRCVACLNIKVCCLPVYQGMLSACVSRCVVCLYIKVCCLPIYQGVLSA